jgi:hypothetical protein
MYLALFELRVEDIDEQVPVLDSNHCAWGSCEELKAREKKIGRRDGIGDAAESSFMKWGWMRVQLNLISQPCQAHILKLQFL